MSFPAAVARPRGSPPSKTSSPRQMPRRRTEPALGSSAGLTPAGAFDCAGYVWIRIRLVARAIATAAAIAPTVVVAVATLTVSIARFRVNGCRVGRGGLVNDNRLGDARDVRA